MRLVMLITAAGDAEETGVRFVEKQSLITKRKGDRLHGLQTEKLPCTKGCQIMQQATEKQQQQQQRYSYVGHDLPACLAS